MIIDETENHYPFEVYEAHVGDGLSTAGMCQGADLIIFDKQQAAQLIDVLQRWIDGGKID
ncbi:hypothetical protein [Atlantibacter hermannii]|uniref:hypothetical protein n=1 Tax=Atlantibacter hermannii TaxID=565 RepID=UPI001C6FE388|nr:hypothetical protein [Atlantibacter hermannii]MBW9430457.1 hypothetical protein [Atlantibacter hermannii]